MTKNILIIGGGKWQIPLVLKAKELGLYTVCTNLYPDSVAFDYADESYVADILDIESNLSIAKKVKPLAIVTDQSDIAVKTVAYLNEKLGLNGVTIDIADLYTNKHRMRHELKVENLHHPKFLLCNGYQEAENFFIALNSPIIIKPPANQSSRGVYKISNLIELKAKFNISQECSVNGSVLVEEFIGGIELTVEGMVIENVHHTLAISKKKPYSNLSYVAKSITYLNEFKEFNSARLKEINNKLFPCVSFAITHVEYKFYNDRFYLIEAAIRGGGTHISSHIIPIVSGIDVTKLLIQTALGKQGIKLKPHLISNCAVLRFFDFKPGKIQHIHGLKLLKQHKNVLDFHLNFKIGDIIDKPSDDSNRIGYYIAYAISKEALEKVILEIKQKVLVEYE